MTFHCLLVNSLLGANLAAAAIPTEDAIAQVAPEIEDLDEPAEPTTEAPQEMAAAAKPGDNRPYDMEFGFRYKLMGIPKSLLDTRFSNASDTGWPLPGEDRPKVNAYSLGLEYIMKFNASNLFFYFDYVDFQWDKGYWDDLDEDFLDGSYLVPTKNLGMATLGVNYAAEVHFVTTEQTQGNFGMSFLIGGGLGASFVTGGIDYWEADNYTGIPAWDVMELDADGTAMKSARIPTILPMVDLNAGFRFNFADRGMVRFEAGLHNILYWGGAVGVML